jgi:hypothetical protein
MSGLVFRLPKENTTQIHDDMRQPGDKRISMNKLEIMLDATDRKLDMYNYLFKLIELDED